MATQSPMFLNLLDAEDDGDTESGGNAAGSDDDDDLDSSVNSSNKWGPTGRKSDTSDSDVSGDEAEGPQSNDVAVPAADFAHGESVQNEALTDEAGLILAARTLEISLEADEAALSSAPSRSVETRVPLTSVVSSKMVRHLKPASTDTSRTAPLPRRSIANRNSSCIGQISDPKDVIPRMNEAALVSALERARRMLDERGMDAAQEAHEALLQVEGLSLSARVPAEVHEVLEAMRQILHAARAHSPLAATIVVHFVRWSENEQNAALLCSGDGLEVLLALMAHRSPSVREPSCLALANLCAQPQGAAALGEARIVERLCAAVRAHLGWPAGGVGGSVSGSGSDRGARCSSSSVGSASSGAVCLGSDDTASSSANVMRGLKKLALAAEGRLALAQGGALQLVTEVSRAHPSANAVVEQALRIIGNVAIDPEREETIIEAGCVQLLCAHLGTADAAVLSADAGALANLISNPQVRSIIVAHGCIRQICAIVSGPMADKPEVYKHASWLLTSLAVEHESRAHVLACGGLELLVAHCARDSAQFHEEGAWALANLSADVRNALPIVDAGALPVLFRLVQSDSPSVQLQATWVFANLSVVDELKPRIGSHDKFVPTLYARLDATRDKADAHRPLRLQTIRTLANLAVDTTNRARVAAGLAVAIDALVGSSRDEITQATLRLMVNLSYDAQIAIAMLQEPRLIAALLENCASPIEPIQQEAVLCIVNLSLDEASEATLVSAGALPPLVAILRSGSQVLQEQAAWALSNVTVTKESKMKVIELGALHTLKSLHRGSSGQMRQASTKIMNSLLSMVTPQSRKVFMPSHSLTIRDSNRGRSPLVDGARTSTATRTPLRAPSGLGANVSPADAQADGAT